MAHHLEQVQFSDGNGGKYQGFVCYSDCQYAIVAYPPLSEKSYHDPNYAMILVKAKTITKEEAIKWLNHYKVDCRNSEGACKASIAVRLTAAIKSSAAQSRFVSTIRRIAGKTL